MNIKKPFICFTFCILLIFFLPTLVYADFGPKDSLTVYVKNPPEEKYYLDLLSEYSEPYNNFHDEEKSTLNQDMIKLLYSYKDEGWMPSLTEGTGVPMWGTLTGVYKNGKMVHEFGYVGVPDTYRIIIVTESGKVTVSDIHTRKALQSSITYNYDTNTAKIPSVLFTYVIQFFTTCIPTLIIELIILLLFKFKLKENYRVFFITNIVTQMFLTLTLGTALIKHGSVSGYLTQFPVEIIILILETIVFSKLLKGNSIKRKIAYGIVANLVSWGVGFFLLSKQFELLVLLL
ncbi:hypothetical protein JYG23_03260 [Sedimentibacter sp. zth1]|uniref:hypothetical protein n=1 Tax=Sedimentibacter sp. zth1 TaxID=2816908 RepID=UPI001A938962|nr:hypothetical protein [Sedimentibacter sp. zth1]QSX06491.1 hypothetical protein JYG23_03260 [Sedimentibacter sp. zth1]